MIGSLKPYMTKSCNQQRPRGRARGEMLEEMKKYI